MQLPCADPVQDGPTTLLLEPTTILNTRDTNRDRAALFLRCACADRRTGNHGQATNRPHRTGEQGAPSPSDVAVRGPRRHCQGVGDRFRSACGGCVHGSIPPRRARSDRCRGLAGRTQGESFRCRTPRRRSADRKRGASRSDRITRRTRCRTGSARSSRTPSASGTGASVDSQCAPEPRPESLDCRPLGRRRALIPNPSSLIPNPQSSNPQSSNPKSSNPRILESGILESRIFESRIFESGILESRIFESRIFESRILESVIGSANRRFSGTKSAETVAPAVDLHQDLETALSSDSTICSICESPSQKSPIHGSQIRGFAIRGFRIQRFRDSGIQGFRDSAIRGSGIQGFGD